MVSDGLPVQAQLKTASEPRSTSRDWGSVVILGPTAMGGRRRQGSRGLGALGTLLAAASPPPFWLGEGEPLVPRASTPAYSLPFRVSPLPVWARVWAVRRRPLSPSPASLGPTMGVGNTSPEKRLWSHFCLDLPPRALPYRSLCPGPRKPPGPQCGGRGSFPHPRISLCLPSSQLATSCRPQPRDRESKYPCVWPSSLGPPRAPQGHCRALR